jgi:hypothetical protein
LLLSGCATTSGREWLDSPIDVATPVPEAAAIVEAPAPTEARPRLRQTITLGESYAVSAGPSAAPVGNPAVQVNVHTQVPVFINNPAGYGYGGYGYGPYGYDRGASSYRPGSWGGPGRATTHGAAQKVGADFPAPPDYGPRALK